MKSIICCICSLLFCSQLQAALWQVNDVLHGTDSGFGYSSLHAANDNTPMSGAILADITSASGTYNDATGEVDFEFGITSRIDASTDTMTLNGFLDFTAGWLASHSVLNYAGLTNLASASESYDSTLRFPAGNNQFGFRAGLDCGGCGGSDNGPNSFVPTGTGDLHYMTLWGADFTNTSFTGDYTGSMIGMDFRVELSAVPVPAAVWLFGTALIGMFSLQRRKALT